MTKSLPIRVSVSTLVFTALLTFGLGYLMREVREEPVAAQPHVPVVVDASLSDGVYTVSKVIDGDTIILETGHHIRYAGIDAPESYDRYGMAAQNLNTSLVLAKRVRIEISEEKPDLYGRTLAFVWQGEKLVNKRLIEDGYATVLVYDKMKKPKYYDDLLAAETYAKSRGWGMWATLERP